jgi:hypothetical protein
MAISATDKKNKIIDKRSQAVMSKINILYSRDGSVHPPIESLADVDLFNLQMLFGGSANENIDWNNMGAEGLIRCYYYIIQKLNGTTRVYNLTNITPGLSSLDQAATELLAGTPYYSGFFGYSPWNESLSNDQKNSARRGVFNAASTSFNDNGATAGGDTTNTSTLINTIISQIGTRSTYGAHHFTPTFTIDPVTGFPILDSNPPSVYDFVGPGILGLRFTDVCPYTPGGYQGGGGGGGGGGYYTPFVWGDGNRDTTGQTSSDGFVANRDYWDPAVVTSIHSLISIIDSIVTYLGYAKMINTNYFLNPNSIPDKSSSYARQDGWISQLNATKAHLNNFLNTCGVGSGTMPTASQTIVDGALDQLKADLTSDRTILLTNSSSILLILAGSFLGTTSDPSTLYGQRFLLVKTILDVSDGSKTALKGINAALAYMNQGIAAAEEQLGLFGIIRQTVPWTGAQTFVGALKIPQIAGIETHTTIDADPNSVNFGELIVNGYILAWDGTAHATAYDIWKSTNWNGTTGTWTKILPVGNSFSIQDVDLNTGKVLSYYIDLNVNPGNSEKPYYKVKAYDSGGSGDYSRIPAESVIGDPHNVDDFASTGGGTTTLPGPSGPPPTAPGSAPPYLFKWTTQLLGSQSADNPVNKTFISEAAFDSIGSNLEVFVDGQLRHKGTGPDEYQISGSQTIILGSALQTTDKVTMIVYFGGSSSGGNWKAPVSNLGALPTIGNSDGDVRLVLSEQKLYVWEAAANIWNVIQSDAILSLAHTQLSDMPDMVGVNADHDTRYYSHIQVDAKIDVLQSEIDALKYLVPNDAAPLAGDLITTSIYYTGYLSNGNERFETLQPTQLFTKIINSPNLTITNSNHSTQFNNADQGTLKLYVNNILVDTFDLAAHWSEANRQTGQIYTPAFSLLGKIRINSVGPYLNYGSHQKGDFTILLGSTDLVAGENKIKIGHLVETQEDQSNNIVIFYDNYATPVTFSLVSVTENQLNSNKYLSGVRHYFSGDRLQIAFTASALYDNTYVMTNQITVNANAYGITQYNVDHTSPGVLNFIRPQIGTVLNYASAAAINIANIYQITPNIRLTGRDPISTSPIYQGITQNFLINTYSVRSDSKNEYFVDEYHRLPNDTYNNIPLNPLNQWNSRNLLTNGQLQVFNSQLIYPSTNFVGYYQPIQTANYSGFAGVRYYFRAFVDSGIPHNNGAFTIQNFTIPDTKRKIELKLPSQTGWLDLTKSYNQATFGGIDGDGCLLGVNNTSFTWTSGSFSTANSGYMIIIRITMTDSTVTPITGISMGW